MDEIGRNHASVTVSLFNFWILGNLVESLQLSMRHKGDTLR